MKKLIIITTLFLSFTTYAQVTPPTPLEKTINGVRETIDTLHKDIKDAASVVDTSSVSKMIYKDVKEEIVGLASALKVGAEHVYKVSVKQQIVKAIVELLACFLLPLILSIVLTYLFVKKWQIFSKVILEESDGLSGLFGGGLLIGLYLLVVFLPSWTTIITGFVNPEYGAINDIMNWVNNARK